MTNSSSRTFLPGVYTPLVTPFLEGSEDVDEQAFAKQVVRLASAGSGLVLFGTNGEASHLTSEERVHLVKVSRRALDEAGLTSVPLLVGTGTGSARDTIVLTKAVAQAGADATIVIPPGYYAFTLGKNYATIKQFFKRVFDESPIPVMIYNFPGAAAGIDLNSDEIIELSEHPNCFGVKLTCAGIGKGIRIANHTQSKEYRARHPNKGPFLVLPGYSDYLLPALVAKHHGCITGTGNVFPKLMTKLFKASAQFVENPTAENLAEAQRLQDIVSQADWIIVKAGINGTKYALNQHIEAGLGGTTRLPLVPASPEIQKMIDVELKKVFELESSL